MRIPYNIWWISIWQRFPGSPIGRHPGRATASRSIVAELRRRIEAAEVLANPSSGSGMSGREAADGRPAPSEDALAEDAIGEAVDGRRGTRRYVLDAQVGFLLRKAQQRHLSIFAAHMGEGLTAQQFAALAKLAEVGPSSQNSLGRQTAMDNSTINGVVRRLHQRGLVEKYPSPEDGRLHMLRLTAEGRRVCDRVLPLAREITRMTVAPLTRDEQATLLRLLRKIG
jgi:MarR family transcriptional regulator, lower aerobic nicotinate degradation pathway regulator